VAEPVHPQVEAYIARAIALGLPLLYTQTPAAARAEFSQIAADNFPPGAPPVAEAEDRVVVVRDGTEIGARLYGSGNGSPHLLVYLHGGGWVIGGLDTVDALCRTLALRAETRVLSVDYRLAPEHRYPVAVEDAFDALGAAADLLGPGGRLSVAGDSAGGNLAAVCAQKARDEGGPELALQVLVYPVTDGDLDTASYREFGGPDAWLSRVEMAWYWDHYLPDHGRRTEPAASPLRADDLRGLPPALVVLAGHDPLHDEGAAYAERLARSGVPTDVVEYGDMVHSFFPMVGVFDRTDEAIAVVAARIRAANAA
jgi:acetyl esterase